VITVENVSKTFGTRTLFEDVSVSFTPGRNYGLTGPNGAGKSTFMKILIGEEPADSGTISKPERTAWLGQDQFAFDEHRVLDVVLMGNPRLWAAMVEKEALYAKDEITDEEGERLGELECVVAEEDGYSAEAEAAAMIEGLGIVQAWHDRPLKELQGGMKLRVLLAQALFGHPEALLLDEPTNHLDMDSIVWLEEFLFRYNGVLVVISHDRRFLNSVCDHIADIDYEAIITYSGNYDSMVRAKAQIRGRIEKEAADKHKKIERLQEFVQRFRGGSRSRQTASRMKQIEKLRPDEIKRSNIARPYIRFEVVDSPSGKDVVRIEGLTKAYGNHVILENFHTDVQRGDKIALLGRNGIGKTSLLEALMDPANEGETVQWGHNTRVGYFGHDHRDQIEPGTTVFEWLRAQKELVEEQSVRAVLGRMLFSGADGAKPTATLSGGEAARLVLCKLILCEYNVLLLDEPTDHLDLESVSALREGIEAFDGTVIFVTHDRDLASAATRIWAYTAPEQLLDFRGGIDEYLEWHSRELEQRKSA